MRRRDRKARRRCKRTGKIGYRDRLDACWVRDRILLNEGKIKRVYECRFCGDFHLTSQPPR